MSGKGKAARGRAKKRNIEVSSGEPPAKGRRVANTELKPEKHTCAVCYDELENTEGFFCPQQCGTFTCWHCLQESYTMAAKPGAIQGGSNTSGELLCTGMSCRSPIKVLDLARSNATEAVINAHEDFKLHVHTTKKVSEALKQQESQIRGEYARIEQIKDAEEKTAMKLRLKIVDEALTMHCPRCKAAFVDFDGCFALQCLSNNCRCGFCAWCLKDCGADAHSHVKGCAENPNRGGGHYAVYYNSLAEFQKHHKQKKIKAVQGLLKKAASSTHEEGP